MRTWRRYAVVSCAALLLALTVACGGNKDNDPSPGTPAATETTAPATTTETASATASTTPGARQLGTRSGVATTANDPAFEALPGATASFGTLGDAVYRMEVPDDWNGSLVMWAHGFRGFGTALSVGSPDRALREQFVGDGYAWAASSFSENGYTPGIGADDTLALYNHFVSEVGEPEYTYIVGESMGGNVVALALEHHGSVYDGSVYDGGLAMCGALGGQEQIDYLVSWGMVAEYTSGVELPIGGGGAAMTTALLQRVAPALGSVASPTPAGEQFISIIRELTGGARPFFIEGLDQQLIPNFGLLLFDPDRETLAGSAGTNVDEEYAIADGLGLTADEINADIRRLMADPEARNGAAHADAVPTTARISAPLLTLHGTGDLFVPLMHELRYYEKAVAEGTDALLVQRLVRTPDHCGFSDAEMVTAWTDLVAWVEGGERPEGDDLTGDLADAGMTFTNPLRPGDPGGR